MSHKNGRKNCFDEKVPVYTCGNYFLAMSGLIKKLEREPTIEVIAVDSHEEVKERLKGPGYGVFVCHAPQREDAIYYLDLVHKLGPSIEARKKKLLLVTSLITPLMGAKLRKFAFFQIVDASIEAFNLFEKVISAVLSFEPDQMWTAETSQKLNNLPPNTESIAKMPDKMPIARQPDSNSAPTQVPTPEKDSNTKPRTSVFHPITNPLRILSYLRECMKYQIKTSLWISSYAKKKYEILIPLVDDVNKVFLITPYDPIEALALELKRWFTSNEQIYLSMTTRRARIFFTTYFADFSSERMVQLLLPEEIYEVQRRAQLRLSVYPEQELFAVMDDDMDDSGGKQNKSYRIDNLSSRGIAILVDQEDLQRFSVGQIVHNLSFAIPDLAVTVKNCEIRHISPYPQTTGQFLVGIYLQSATAHQASVLEFYVYQANLAYLQAVS